VELVNDWYYRLILRDFIKLDEAAQNILPSNRRIVNNFVSSQALNFVNDIMSGIHITGPYDGIDSQRDHAFLFSRFREHVFERRKRIVDVLDKLNFCIDEENTLALVTGDGRLDNVSTICLIALSQN
jgi:hypothetical protein